MVPRQLWELAWLVHVVADRKRIHVLIVLSASVVACVVMMVYARRDGGGRVGRREAWWGGVMGSVMGSMASEGLAVHARGFSQARCVGRSVIRS